MSDSKRPLCLRRSGVQANTNEVAPSKKFKRVWFVGAGFTTAVGYPLGRGLVAEIVNYLKNDESKLLIGAPQAVRERFVNSLACGRHANDRLKILELIERFSRQYLARSLDELTSVEVAEFYSVAQALAEQPGLLAQAAPATSFASLYHDLASVTRTFFVDLCDSVECWPDDFQSILRGIRPDEDAIVNFNWDEEVDCFLSNERDDHGKGGKEFDVVYTRNSWQQDRFLILKPHGSIGWYDVAQGIANRDIYFIAEDRDDRIPRLEKRIIAYSEFELPRDIAKTGAARKAKPFTTGCPPVITPPTFGKRFPYAEQRLIWSDIIDICRGAEQFVFLGYSVPKDDFLTRAAIRCALDARRKSAKHVGCIVVTKLTQGDEQAIQNTIANFGEIFTNAFGKKNLLRWTFGQSKPADDLFPTIIDRLGRGIT